MELLRDNWEITQLKSMFTSPSQNSLLIACMTLWLLLFTMPLRRLRIDVPQSELIIFTLSPYSVLSDITPLWQFPLQINSHHVINTSQRGWEQDRKNYLSSLIAFNLWWFCMYLLWQWLQVSWQWNVTHQHGLWLWEETGYDSIRKGTGKECYSIIPYQAVILNWWFKCNLMKKVSLSCQ